MMSISFESEEIILKKLQERLRRMTDEELTKFGKDVRRLAENPFQKKLEEARAEWKRRKETANLNRWNIAAFEISFLEDPSKLATYRVRRKALRLRRYLPLRMCLFARKSQFQLVESFVPVDVGRFQRWLLARLVATCRLNSAFITAAANEKDLQRECPEWISGSIGGIS
jgi:hypothetical protein